MTLNPGVIPKYPDPENSILQTTPYTSKTPNPEASGSQNSALGHLASCRLGTRPTPDISTVTSMFKYSSGFNMGFADIAI